MPSNTRRVMKAIPVRPAAPGNDMFTYPDFGFPEMNAFIVESVTGSPL